MKTCTRVGGPLLGEKHLYKQVDLHRHTATRHQYGTPFEPILTPLLSNSSQQRLILLPHERFVTVLAYKTGRPLANLVPRKEKNHACWIHSVGLARVGRILQKQTVEQQLLLQQDGDSDNDEEEDQQQEETHEYVLLVGCSDGSIQEFTLHSLLKNKSTKENSKLSLVGDEYNLLGPCHGPRRVFAEKGKQQPLLRMTIPPLSESADGTLVYGLVMRGEAPPNTKEEGEASSKTKSIKSNMSLVRMVIPPFDQNNVTSDTMELGQDRFKVVDTFKCKMRKSYTSFPFCLLSTSRKNNRDSFMDVFVIVGRSTSVEIYHEQQQQQQDSATLETRHSSHPIKFIMPRHNRLTALAASSTDLACGHAEGDIRVWTDIFSTITDYQAKIKVDKTTPHPSSTVLVRRLHWHAHAVTTLSYYNGTQLSVDPQLLYSGGEESVLVSWQLGRGTDRPADMLPRIAKGGIVFIGNVGSAILIYCSDNSLQLLESHNRSLLWKREGLPNNDNATQFYELQSSICADPLERNKQHTVVLRGMTKSPGYLHWYSVGEQRVVGKLEVVPYNRVSRTESTDEVVPSPSVLHSCFSKNGTQLVTLDAVWSENRFAGARCFLSRRTVVGVTHTIRFWNKSSLQDETKKDGVPYVLSAAMTNPHGRENTVTAMALSSDGRFVCSVSNDENAFRVWHSVAVGKDEKDDEKSSSPWVCQYKITTPSGYSNFGTSPNGVAFSSDGSLLAICYGSTVTLWDHENATLVTSLRHLEDDNAPIDSVEFVKTDFLHDLLLTKSRNGVTLQSVFQEKSDGWSYGIFGNEQKDAHVSHVELIPTHNIVAVSFYRHGTRTSQVVLLDAATGLPKRTNSGEQQSNMTWYVPGIVRAMGVASNKLQRPTAWSSVSSPKKQQEEPPIRLYVLTDNGEMLMLQADGQEPLKVDNEELHDAIVIGKRRSMLSSTDAPVLNLPAARKRTKTILSMNDEEISSKLDLFGTVPSSEDGAPSAPLASSDLPVLSSAFTRAFLGRNLVKSVSGAGAEKINEQG